MLAEKKDSDQADLELRCPHMSKDTVSHGATHTIENQLNHIYRAWTQHFLHECMCARRKRRSACASTHITKTCLYNFDPRKPHFYMGLQGYTLFFLFLLKNIDCGYSLEPPRRGGSNEYTQSFFLSRNIKNIRIFYLKLFIFWW